MQKNSQNFSMQEALRLARSDAGQQLLAMLRQYDSATLRQAADQAAGGNYRELSKLLEDPQLQALLKQLGK